MEYLEAGHNLDWNLYPSGGRELDPIKIDRYLNRIPDEYVEAATFVLNNSEYVTFNKFRDKLQQSFDLFQDNIGNQPFYLVYPTQGKIGSENWLTHLLYPQIKQLNLVGILDNSTNILAKIPSGSNVVLIDDAIYSGCNMAGTIDEMSYPCGNSKTFRFHLIVPYAKEEGIRTVSGDVSKKFVYNFYSVVTMTDTDKLSNDNLEVARFNDDLGSEDAPVAIYFDWKVANEFGSYPQLYLEGAIPEPRREAQQKDKFGLAVCCVDHKNILVKTEPLLKMLPTRQPINQVISLISQVDQL